MSTSERHVRLFRNGRNQALRIPREFELEGEEALIHKEGDRLIVQPIRKGKLLVLLASLDPLTEPFPDIDDDLPHWVTGRYEWLASVFTGHQHPVRSCPQSARHGGSKITKAGEDTICTSIIVAAELRYGAIKSKSAKLAERIDMILSTLETLPLETPADHQYALLRHHLTRQGTPIGQMIY